MSIGKPSTVGELKIAIVGSPGPTIASKLDQWIRESSYGLAWPKIDVIYDFVGSVDAIPSWIASHPGWMYYIFQASASYAQGQGEIHSNPAYCWVYTLSDANWWMILHEFMHSLGFNHSHNFNAPIPASGVIPATSISTGDSSDAMYAFIHPNAPHKDCLGWLRVPEITADCEIEIFPYETGVELMAIKFPHPQIITPGSPPGHIWLCYRQPIGIDSQAIGLQGWFGGVSIYFAQTWAIGTPADTLSYNSFAVCVHPTDYPKSWVVRPGEERFDFLQAGVSMNVLKADSVSAIFQLRFGSIVPPPSPPPTPEPECIPFPDEYRTIPCPKGYKGYIRQKRVSTCPGPTWGPWVTIENTCKKGKK